MISQYQTIQFTRRRGPGTESSASSAVFPSVTVTRPNSTCANTLITQPMRMSQSSQNPASAPVFVVATSSPDPTMAPATISPGPRF